MEDGRVEQTWYGAMLEKERDHLCGVDTVT